MRLWKRPIISFIGVPTNKLGENLTLYSDPVIIPISNGTKFYGSGSETRYIHDMYVLSDLKERNSNPRLKVWDLDLKSQQKKIARLEEQMQVLKTSGDIWRLQYTGPSP